MKFGKLVRRKKQRARSTAGSTAGSTNFGPELATASVAFEDAVRCWIRDTTDRVSASQSSASSSAPITVSAVRPWRTALQREFVCLLR